MHVGEGAEYVPVDKFAPQTAETAETADTVSKVIDGGVEYVHLSLDAGSIRCGVAQWALSSVHAHETTCPACAGKVEPVDAGRARGCD